MNKKSIEIARSKVRSNHKQVKYLKDVFSGAHFGCGCKFWRVTEVEMSGLFLKALLIEKCIILAKSALLLNQFSMLSHSFDSVNWIYTSKFKTSKLLKRILYLCCGIYQENNLSQHVWPHVGVVMNTQILLCLLVSCLLVFLFDDFVLSYFSNLEAATGRVL